MKKQFNEKNLTDRYSDNDEYKSRDKKRHYENKKDYKGESWRYIEKQKTNQRRTSKNPGKRVKSPYDKW